MKVIRSLDQPLPTDRPLLLTIGNFDGVHRGHLEVLQKLKELSSSINGSTAVLTFENHPSTVLRPDHPVAALCSTEHKLKLLENAGIDHVILLPFTYELSQQTAETFLRTVKSCLPFKQLILGYDALLGKERQGNPEVIRALAQDLQFHSTYIPPYMVDDVPVSSSRIREAIRKGELIHAETLLGRKFSFYNKVTTGLGLGKTIGFATANLSVDGLCLPPLGVYAVELKEGAQCFKGIANLGIAPTIRTENKPILEAHLFNCNQSFYGKDVEVILHAYIRPEKTFPGIEELRAQITLDIDCAHAFFVDIDP